MKQYDKSLCYELKVINTYIDNENYFYIVEDTETRYKVRLFDFQKNKSNHQPYSAKSRLSKQTVLRYSNRTDTGCYPLSTKQEKYIRSESGTETNPCTARMISIFYTTIMASPSNCRYGKENTYKRTKEYVAK